MSELAAKHGVNVLVGYNKNVADYAREQLILKQQHNVASSHGSGDYGRSLLDDVFATSIELRDKLDGHMRTVHDNVAAAFRSAIRKSVLAPEHKRDFEHLSKGADSYRHLSRAKCACLRNIVDTAIARPLEQCPFPFSDRFWDPNRFCTELLLIPFNI